MAEQKRAVLIAGPTASGKSALALARAEAGGGVIVNADSMQVYDVLETLTARPTREETARAPHLLYGFVHPSVRFSTGAWVRDVHKLIQDSDLAGRELIFVGGTGLYFDALTKGFAEVPEIPDAVVEEAEKLIQPLNEAGRAALLAEADPAAAARLRVADPQRVVRALAVKRATGRTLSEFHERGQAGLLEGFSIERIVLNPDRDVLRARIRRRFEEMMDAGAVQEVEALRGMTLDPSLPAMKAIGVKQISAWLDGQISREEAVELSTIATAQYAKRQRTWFRNRMTDWDWVDPLA